MKRSSNCKECGKYYKSIGYNDIKLQCSHINSKKHQKNKLILDNKCYNALISLVKCNVSNDLIGEINKKVIQNYEKQKDNENLYWQNQGINNKIQEDLTNELTKKYNYQCVRQITYNDEIKFRLLTNDKNSKLINNIQFEKYLRDVSHMSIKDFDMREKWQGNLFYLKERLSYMNNITKHLINNRLNDEYELVKYGDDREIDESMEDLYGLDNNKTIEDMIEELEAFIDNAPITLVYN